jgi:hypothetical protein
MWVTRSFIILGAGALVFFFVWPWIQQLNLTGEISIRAGGFSAHIPAIMGVFATLGLAAMLIAVKR